MDCRLFGGAPLSKPMMPFLSFDPWKHIWMKLETKYNNFHRRKWSAFEKEICEMVSICHGPNVSNSWRAPSSVISTFKTFLSGNVIDEFTNIYFQYKRIPRLNWLSIVFTYQLSIAKNENLGLPWCDMNQIYINAFWLIIRSRLFGKWKHTWTKYIR